MLETKQNVIFVTADEKRAKFFMEMVECSCAENNPVAFFDLYRSTGNKPFVLDDPVKLQKILWDFNHSKLAHTLIIIDYLTLDNHFRIQNSNGTLAPFAELILMYPEVRFRILRDNHDIKPVFGCPKEKETIRSQYLCLTFDELVNFGIKLKSGIQLFDPSGIRNFLKKALNDHIKTIPDNYQALHTSREKHFALAIDEEKKHALFWAYALYSFGFSVLPVITSTELKKLREIVERDDESKIINLICRDYDLQFSDIDNGSQKESQLACYRGLMREENNKTDSTTKSSLKLHKTFWEAFFKKKDGIGKETHTWIISQIPTLGSIKEMNSNNRDLWIAGPKVKKSLEKKLNPEKYWEFQTFGITIYEEHAFLKGHTKEISGIMDLLESEEISGIFQQSRDYTMIERERGSISNHALPAVNLKITEAIMTRAKKAYEESNYLISALLASEALEIINGLSTSLSLGALHLKSLAEAQMELDVVGIGDFKKVIKKKIYEIRRQIKRICTDNHLAEKNARMQIFNQLRHIFEESQQFDTAELLYEEVIKAEFSLPDLKEFEFRQKSLMKSSSKIENSEYIELKDNPGDKNNKNSKYQKKKGNRYSYVWPLVRNSFYTWYLFIFILLLGGNAIYSSIIHKPSYEFMGLYSVMFMILLLRGKKLLFTIIGGGTNFIRFICSYILINIILILICFINNRRGSIANNVEQGFYSLFSFLINEPFKLDVIMPSHWIFLFFIFFHVLLSMVYLGVFIAAIYRWLTRR